MILEVAILYVIPGQGDDFELAFDNGSGIIAGMSGYVSHPLQRSLEKLLLFVDGQSGHTSLLQSIIQKTGFDGKCEDD